MITVENLTKKYGDKVVVDNISFKVNEGEIFSLVGPNGAGKTTTVEILECLKKPTSGRAKVMGYDVYREEKHIKQNIGVMPQNFNAFERLTAQENIQLMADIYGRGNVDEIIEMVGVQDFANKRFEDLSGGMKTRVGIGMSVVTDAPLVFLDEPTTGLDPHARRDTWHMIKNLQHAGKTVFLTTHYMEEVEQLADKVAVIIEGRIKVIDTTLNLIKQYGGEVRLTVRREEEAEDILKNEGGRIIEESPYEITALFEDKVKAGYVLTVLFGKNYDVRVVEAGMEDAFMNLAGSKINERGELV